MSEDGKDTERGPLNPALRTRKDESHDTRRSSPPPADSASVQKEEGRAWPVIWLVVTILCVVLAIYIFFW